jgi:hypothetical protein
MSSTQVYHSVPLTSFVPTPSYNGHPSLIIRDYTTQQTTYLDSPYFPSHIPSAYTSPIHPNTQPIPTPTSIMVEPHIMTPPSHLMPDDGSLQPYSRIPNIQSAKKEMNMARAGTDSSLAGIDTPIARHVGELILTTVRLR